MDIKMLKQNCTHSTVGEKRLYYQQYYKRHKDKEGRRTGKGENNWSGAKSLESYNGNFTNDTLHGVGDYRWRHRGPENASVTYEGYFYCNNIHGYGTMSYPDGRTFTGLFMFNVRWGPGVESHANVRNDVGLWRGRQLVRLSWRPLAPSIVPDFMTNSSGRTIVEAHRILLRNTVQNVSEVSNAVELLKKCGADPRVAVEKWKKLYPKYCTDVASSLFNTDLFNRDYYNKNICLLEEIDPLPDSKEIDIDDVSIYYAWNNSKIMVNMMKHSFKHDRHKDSSKFDIQSILSGPRTHFKPPGNHELGCRNLLMASYLGHVADVAYLVNESRIHPDLSDVQGNSAVIYATCGDQPEIIHFLIQAGANIDAYNDCCCTALGIALMRYICVERDIPLSGMLQALLPPPLLTTQTTTEQKVFEWNIKRELPSSPWTGVTIKIPSKTKNLTSKNSKSLLSIIDRSSRRKTEPLSTLPEQTDNSNDVLSEENQLYNYLNQEFYTKATNTFTFSNNSNPISYLFDVNDMVKEIEANEEEKKQPEKSIKKVTSKVFKDTTKTNIEVIQTENLEKEESLSGIEKQKINALSKIMVTILQLLSNGANPRLVRCPQPAMMIAATSNCPDLIRHLVHYGADVNETYHQINHYSPLDVAVSRPFTIDNFNIIKALLECGADPCHRLLYERDLLTNEVYPGPTLLHVALGRKTESDVEESIRLQLIELLLKYNCNSTLQFKGRSPIDIAMNKSVEVFDIFIKNPKTKLNAVINDSNQSVLVKLFHLPFFRSVASSERIHMLKNLLLCGSDPLIKCQNGEDVYENIFVFAKRTLMEMESTQNKSNPSIGKQGGKPKKIEKSKKEEKLSTKSIGKMSVDEVEDYKQAIELVTDCARLIYIRWLETKLMKELIEVIKRYKHRHWNIILKQFNGHTNIGLWLTPQRCIKIWHILCTNKTKNCNNTKILKYLLCIVIFMSLQNYGKSHGDMDAVQIVTANLKDAIEVDANLLLRQHKVVNSDMGLEMNTISYKPELIKDNKKFNICFECMLPLNDEKILCSSCEFVSFCSLDCMKTNNNRTNCHPCSNFIKTKYFPNSQESVV